MEGNGGREGAKPSVECRRGAKGEKRGRSGAASPSRPRSSWCASPPIRGTRSIITVPSVLSGNLSPGTRDCHICKSAAVFQRLREAKCTGFPGMSIAYSRLRPKTLTQSHPNRVLEPRGPPLTRGRRWKVNQAFHSRPPAIQWACVLGPHSGRRATTRFDLDRFVAEPTGAAMP